MFAPVPTGTAQRYEYGLNDDYYGRTFASGWIWQGSNGTFTVSPGATAELDAVGTTLPVFGTTDLRLTLDLQDLGSGGPFDTSRIRVKGSSWLWVEQELPGCTPPSPRWRRESELTTS